VLLRASGEAEGRALDLRAITDAAAADGSGIAHAAELLRFTDAAVRGPPIERAAARDALLLALGREAVVDTAAVIGNFERMTRVADATGTPLDAPVEMVSGDFRAALGLDAFATARNTPRGGPLRRALAPLLRPLLRRGMRYAHLWVARR